jgi:cytosine/adenosine deaminase-related metal-dependent hydrolase
MAASPPTFFIADVLVPDDAIDDGYGYARVDVTLAGRQIAAVAPAGSSPPPLGATLVNGTDKLLLPGTVNAHTHTSEHWARGLIKARSAARERPAVRHTEPCAAAAAGAVDPPAGPPRAARRGGWQAVGLRRPLLAVSFGARG